MIVYVNENGEIHDVGTTTDETLISVEIIDDEDNPFHGWSDARICCYRVQVVEGRVVMMTPYVSSILIDFVDRFGTDIAENQEATAENSDAIIEVSEDSDTLITELEDAFIELTNSIAE
jgi:hypothetical protein